MPVHVGDRKDQKVSTLAVRICPKLHKTKCTAQAGALTFPPALSTMRHVMYDYGPGRVFGAKSQSRSTENQRMKLENTVSVITGGGKGIGKAIALRFAEEGSAIVISGTTESALNEVAGEINGRGGRAIAVTGNVADEGMVKNLISTAISEFGKIDILVNNAGIAGPTAPVVQVNLEDWERTMAINLTGTFLCSKYALPSMIERKSGRVINITSVAGLMGYALRSPYAASKWAMIGLTRTLALEVGRYNITVNAIAPGPVRGPRIEAVIENRATQTGKTFQEVESEYVDRIALQRMVDESDIVEMALFLAGESGRNISGETLTISGGFPL